LEESPDDDDFQLALRENVHVISKQRTELIFLVTDMRRQGADTDVPSDIVLLQGGEVGIPSSPASTTTTTTALVADAPSSSQGHDEAAASGDGNGNGDGDANNDARDQGVYL
jgi:hypothetical protein